MSVPVASRSPKLQPRTGPAGRRSTSRESGPRLGLVPCLLLAALALTTAFVFRGALEAGFLPLDDPNYVAQDPWVSRGVTWDGIVHYLKTTHTNTWHPLTTFSHMLDVSLFGLEPLGHHAVSVLIHAINGVLLALVLFRLTGAWWRSFLVAALFALHPLRVESVAWVSERKDVLSLFWMLVAIELYRRWTRHPSTGRLVAVAGAFLLGLMSKPMLVTLPFVLVLLDVWPLRRLQGSSARTAAGAAPPRSLAGLVVEKWPLLLISACASALTFVAQRDTGAMVKNEWIPLATRLANAALAVARYVGQTLWPSGLAIYYPYDPTIGAAAWIGCTLGIAAVTAAVLILRRACPAGAVGWLWFLGTLVPVIGIVQVGTQAHADRYTYIPAIGLTIALVWGVAALAARWPALARPTLAVAAIAVLASTVATTRQVAHWTSPVRLFQHTLSVTRDNPVAREALGSALIDAGDVAAALPHLDTAWRMGSRRPNLENNLGSALASVGRFDEAIAVFRSSLRNHDTADMRFNLATALAAQGRFGDAVAEYEAALRLDPSRRETIEGLAHSLERLGRHVEARAVREGATGVAEVAGESRTP